MSEGFVSDRHGPDTPEPFHYRYRYKKITWKRDRNDVERCLPIEILRVSLDKSVTPIGNEGIISRAIGVVGPVPRRVSAADFQLMCQRGRG